MRYALVSSMVVSALVTAAAQNTPQQTDPAATFRTDARLVRVTVVVHDERGQPVPGLTANDFEVLEDRKRVPIALFSVEGTAAPAAPERAELALPPNVFSNRIEGPSASGVTLILYDRLNTPWNQQRQAKDEIVSFLKKLRPTDRVGLYLLEGDAITVLHDFSRDASSLLKLLDRAVVPTSQELAMSTDRLPRGLGDDAEMERWILRAEQQIQGFAMERRVDASTRAMEALGRALAGVRGRKNVIWISSGFPTLFNDGISRQNRTTQVRRSTHPLNDSDVAMYPVDARGLMVYSTPASAQRQQFVTLGNIYTNAETLQTIAEYTGGRAFFNTNGLADAMARAVDDSKLTYVLGYYPTNTNWDGRFREIKVRARSPGVQVRHRTGYFATLRVQPTVEDRKKVLTDALASPLDSTGLQLSVAFEGGTNADEVRLAIRVEGDAIQLTTERDALVGALDIAIAQELPDGRLIRSVDTVIPLRFKAAEREQVLKKGIELTRTLIVRNDAHQIKIAIRDASGSVGTVTIPASRIRVDPRAQ